MNLLLLSNSTMAGEEYLSWPKQLILEHLEGSKNLLFVPYAGVSITWDDYTQRVRQALGWEKSTFRGIHTFPDTKSALAFSDAILVGGGNTFQLLERLQAYRQLSPIRSAVLYKGKPYVGWSAGSNVACPGIYTTNDMPIVQPQSFHALNLISFQINAHYINKTIEGHGGESRDMRLNEMGIAQPKLPIVGLEEGSGVKVKSGRNTMVGSARGFVFEGGKMTRQLEEGDTLSF
jgi:dipeptidase E